MANRVQIPFGFQQAVTVYTGANNTATSTTVTSSILEPVPAGTAVAITDRNTHNPITVYAAETGGTTIASVVTDANGNVPGWVNEGSYKLVVSASGSFAGATINWDAVRGDGVGNIAPQAVTVASLSALVASGLAQVGTIQDFAGTALPNGWLWCDGSAYATATYPVLSSVLGTAWNGSPGAGNFNVPDLRQRVTMGKATAGTGSTLGSYGGSVDHNHPIPVLSVPSIAIPSLSVPSQGVLSGLPNHTHTLSAFGYAKVGLNFHPGSGFGAGAGTDWHTAHIEEVGNTFTSATHYWGIMSQQEGIISDYASGPVAALATKGAALAGSTDNPSSLPGIGGATSGGSTTPNTTSATTTASNTNGGANQAFGVVNKIIKHDYV